MTELDPKKLIIAVCGYTLHGSKRWAPPMAICNAWVFFNGEHIHTTDLDIYNKYDSLGKIAGLLDCKIEIKHEHSNNIVWSSETPAMWLGYCGSEMKAPQPFRYVYQIHKELSDSRIKQWTRDHRMGTYWQNKWWNICDRVNNIKYETKWKFHKLFKKLGIK